MPISGRTVSSGGTTFFLRPNKLGLAKLRNAIAVGVAQVMLDAETEAKREAPVRGGYRSFVPGTKPIGGTLRRSIHSATFLDGKLVSQHVEAVPGSTRPPGPLPEMAALPGRIVGYVGTNSGYGAFVELGTVRMTPRPFLGPGLEVASKRAVATIARAVQRAGG